MVHLSIETRLDIRIDGDKTDKRISVVIPVKNSRIQLDEQLNALAVQDYRGAFDVVVSDNGSSDGLEEHIGSHPLRDRLSLRYVDASKQSGAAFARNVGAQHANGHYLAFCDADDAVHPTWLSALASALATHDVVGTALETDTLNTESVKATCPAGPPEQQGRTEFLPFAIGASLGCRSEVYHMLGGMEVDLQASEDVEFSWRAQLSGYSFNFVDEAHVSYRLRSDLRTMWTQSRRLGYGTGTLQSKYAHLGCPPQRVRTVVATLAVLALSNPLVRRWTVRTPTGVWVRAFAGNVGLLQAWFRTRRATELPAAQISTGRSASKEFATASRA